MVKRGQKSEDSVRQDKAGQALLSSTKFLIWLPTLVVSLFLVLAFGGPSVGAKYSSHQQKYGPSLLSPKFCGNGKLHMNKHGQIGLGVE